MFNITSKCEVNIRRGLTISTDVKNIGMFMVKNRFPVLVIDPEFIEPMFFERNKMNGHYKIITTVDVYNGNRYAMDKFKDLPRFALESDGLEIMLTHNRSDVESKNELKIMTEFLKKFNPRLDLRYVMGFRTRPHETLQNNIQHIKEYPCSYIRTDPNTNVPNLQLEKHIEDIAFIKKSSGNQIKISGSVTLDTIRSLPHIQRFDVSLPQAKRIIKELTDNPELAGPKTPEELSQLSPPDLDERVNEGATVEQQSAHNIEAESIFTGLLNKEKSSGVL